MSKQTKAGFETALPVIITDNSNGEISAADERAVFTNLKDSVPFLNGTETIDGNWIFDGSGHLRFTPVVSSAATLTLSTAWFYIFSGSSSTTWTLPALSGLAGKIYWIKNRGSAAITLNRAGSDQIWNVSAITSITINPGASTRLLNDGTYWVII